MANKDRLHSSFIQGKVNPVDRKRFVRLYASSLLAIIVFALFPVASVLLAGLIATPAGCELNEAVVNPCIIAGIDLGELLYAMGVLGWLMIGTIPVGVILLAIWAAILICHLIVHRLKRLQGP